MSNSIPNVKKLQVVSPTSNCQLLRYPHTDTGSAERLIVTFGERIRYYPESKGWLVWDGNRWCQSGDFTVWQMAKQTVRSLYAEAARITEDKHRAAVAAFARASESASRIRAMLECAKGEPGIAISTAELDQNPWLLNCRNGTLDLKTGDFRQPSPGDLITKTCMVDFDRDADCMVFRQFLDRIFGENAEVISYIQRAIGYALTGVVTEKAMFCFFGKKDNGKTTLLEIMRYILGDYAGQIMIESLVTKSEFYRSTAMADLAGLPGVRFVTTSEADHGTRLAEALVKQLTGGGQLKACLKYGNPFAFTPTHKIFMDSNYKPVISGNDEAMWTRLRAVPFKVIIPRAERDKGLLDKLRKEAPGILRWAVEGCFNWQDFGLGEPVEVTESIEDWRAESDPIKAFIEGRCEISSDALAPAGDLLAAFEEHAENEGVEVNQRQFCEHLRRLGCTPHRTKTKRFWHGIGLKA